MDNITHSLAGLLLAEAAVRLRAGVEHEESTPRLRATAAIAWMVAANLPDADLFYTGVGGDRLRYMLHHRGYSGAAVHSGADLAFGRRLGGFGRRAIWRRLGQLLHERASVATIHHLPARGTALDFPASRPIAGMKQPRPGFQRITSRS